jgi:hypothetical protein
MNLANGGNNKRPSRARSSQGRYCRSDIERGIEAGARVSATPKRSRASGRERHRYRHAAEPEVPLTASICRVLLPHGTSRVDHPAEGAILAPECQRRFPVARPARSLEIRLRVKKRGLTPRTALRPGRNARVTGTAERVNANVLGTVGCYTDHVAHGREPMTADSTCRRADPESSRASRAKSGVRSRDVCPQASPRAGNVKAARKSARKTVTKNANRPVKSR